MYDDMFRKDINEYDRHYDLNSPRTSNPITDGLERYRLPEILPEGVFCGWDAAKTRDRSAIIILQSERPTSDTPFPKLKCRLKKNMKGMRFKDQRALVERLDIQYGFSCLTFDKTRHEESAEELAEAMGGRFFGINFTKPKKASMITAVRKLFENQMIEFDPTHQYHNLMRKELYELDPISLKHPQTASGSDDFVWALALCIAGLSESEHRSSVQSGYGSDMLMF